VISFGPLPERFGDLSIFGKMSDSTRRVRIIRNDPETIINLPPSIEEYLDSIGTRERREHRRRLSKLQKTYDVEIGFADNQNFGERDFSEFADMHREQWSKQKQPGHFGAWPGSLDFHRDLSCHGAQSGLLRMMCLSLDKKIVAYKYMFIWGDSYFSFLPARDSSKELLKYGLGKLITVKAVDFALNEGVRKIDLLQGHQEHKTRLGGNDYPTHSITIIRNRKTERIRFSILKLSANIINILYYKIWIRRVAPRLNMRKKPFWRLWIRLDFLNRK
jgi:CelD/BcsL family acetyltransferase involved in cellulose biosynthesis